MKGQNVIFSSGKDDWQTPKELFDRLNDEFHFTLDGAANAENHLCDRWLGPGSSVEDALSDTWAGERIFCNPPYSQAKKFIEKGFIERFVAFSVFLVPARTDTKWWHSCVWNMGDNDWIPYVQVRFIKGRVKFVDPTKSTTNSAPFPSVLVIFGEH